MATYTLLANGTAGSLAAALQPTYGDPTDPSTCLSFAGHASYASGASPGDTFQLADNGGHFRSTLGGQISGTSGNRITYEAYPGDTPIINGSDLVTGWTLSGTSNIWKASVSTRPKQIWIDDNFGDRKDVDDATGGGAESLTNEYDWFWDEDGSYFDNEATTLYLYAPGDPDTQYTTPGVEAASRQDCLNTNFKEYLNIDGITCSKSNRSGIYLNKPSYITVSNCIGEWAWNYGLWLYPDPLAASQPGNIIEDNTFRYCGQSGITCNIDEVDLTGVIIRRNRCYEIDRHTYRPNDANWEYMFNFTGGIKMWSSRATAAVGWQIYENVCYDCGPEGITDNKPGSVCGIWSDALLGTSENPVQIYRNLCYNNSGTGIFHEISRYVDIYNNVIYDCALSSNVDNQWAGAGIRVDNRYDWISGDSKIYNNTIAGCWIGIQVTGYNQSTGELNNVMVKNNICSGNDIELRASNGGDNGTYGSGNVYENNCIGAEASGFISWGGSTYDTYATWKTAHGEAWDQVEGDPSFTDTGSDDYTLASGSPCINTGENVMNRWDMGAYIYQGTKDPSFNIALMPESSWTGSVVTGDQDEY